MKFFFNVYYGSVLLLEMNKSIIVFHTPDIIFSFQICMLDVSCLFSTFYKLYSKLSSSTLKVIVVHRHFIYIIQTRVYALHMQERQLVVLILAHR